MKRVCPSVDKQILHYALGKTLYENVFDREPLPCLSRGCQPCVQLNVDATFILGFDKAMISLKGTFTDDDSLALPHATILGPEKRRGLNARHCNLVLFDIKLETS